MAKIFLGDINIKVRYAVTIVQFNHDDFSITVTTYISDKVDDKIINEVSYHATSYNEAIDIANKYCKKYNLPLLSHTDIE